MSNNEPQNEILCTLLASRTDPEGEAYLGVRIISSTIHLSFIKMIICVQD